MDNHKTTFLNNDLIENNRPFHPDETVFTFFVKQKIIDLKT